MNPKRLARLSIASVAILMSLALYGALARLGWNLPATQVGSTVGHGALMASGVLGTLISVERAVALSVRLQTKAALFAFAAPLLTATGALLLVFSASSTLGQTLITLGSVVLMAVYAITIRQQRALFTLVMGLGAVSWAAGNALWLMDRPVYSVVYWWIGFLVLTIVGERLELARVMRPAPARQWTFALAAAVFVSGIALTRLDLNAGIRVFGAGEIALAAWLFRYDIVRFTIRQQGLPRFIAWCLSIGYGWLAAGGALAIVYGEVYAGFRYDAVLHTVLLGFVFSMIFGHAPIIIPALLKLPVPMRSSFYAHLIVLHAALMIRVGSDLLMDFSGRKWGGLLNEVAIVLFLVNTVRAVTGARRTSAQIKTAAREAHR